MQKDLEKVCLIFCSHLQDFSLNTLKEETGIELNDAIND
jgi:hypothetical protein